MERDISVYLLGLTIYHINDILELTELLKMSKAIIESVNWNTLAITYKHNIYAKMRNIDFVFYYWFRERRQTLTYFVVIHQLNTS